MATKEIATPSLLVDEIYSRQPSPETIRTYRLMAEASHGLSGCPTCSCMNAICEFHLKDEPLLCIESEADYGFHSANTWERR